MSLFDGVFDAQTEHCQVIVGNSTITVFLNQFIHLVDDLFGILEGRETQNVDNLFVAELFLTLVLGLIQSIGVDEERRSLDIVNLLTFVINIRE